MFEIKTANHIFIISSSECDPQIRPEVRDAILKKVSEITKDVNLAQLDGFDEKYFICRIGKGLELYTEEVNGFVKRKGKVTLRSSHRRDKMIHFMLWEKLSEESQILVA